MVFELNYENIGVVTELGEPKELVLRCLQIAAYVDLSCLYSHPVCW